MAKCLRKLLKKTNTVGLRLQEPKFNPDNDGPRCEGKFLVLIPAQNSLSMTLNIETTRH